MIGRISFQASAVASDNCGVEVECSLRLIKTGVRDFSQQKERFTHDEKAHDASRLIDSLSLT